jgi:hypothetical protein
MSLAANEGIGILVFWLSLLAFAAVIVWLIWQRVRRGMQKQEIYFNNTWHKIQLGFTEEQVRTLLGTPEKITANVTPLGQMFSEWRYGSLFCIGKVQFLEGKVVGFTMP